MLPAFTLWWREIVRFYRQPGRVVGVLASPLVFWLVLGSGFGTSFRSGGGAEPTALSGLLLSRHPDPDRALHFDLHHDVGDRRPQGRISAFGAGRARAANGDRAGQGARRDHALGDPGNDLSDFCAVRRRASATSLQVLLVAVVVFLVSFSLTALGFAIAWPMDSSQAFHGIVNLFLIPLWLLSGALFSAHWRVGMDSGHDAPESADLWRGSAARTALSGRGNQFPAVLVRWRRWFCFRWSCLDWRS